MLGFLTGAAIFGEAYPTIFPPINALINLGSTILPTALYVDLWMSVMLFGLMALTLFYFLEKFGALRKDKASE